jgi:hypothetical protein
LVDSRQNGLCLLFNLKASKTQHLDSSLCHPAIADRIMDSTLVGKMAFSIHFNHNLRFGAIEVRRIRAQWMLSPKLLAHSFSIAKQLPHESFEAVSGLALASCELDLFAGILKIGALPARR